MLDIKYIREYSHNVAENAKNKGYSVDVDRLLQLDTRHRADAHAVPDGRAALHRRAAAYAVARDAGAVGRRADTDAARGRDYEGPDRRAASNATPAADNAAAGGDGHAGACPTHRRAPAA